ncbi:hypothetical protein EJ06DRAFT_469890 [Trichodelitschia bisporula]|uniref:Thioesterase domain-containing protein n=1 Tax=Trichodelitschia bisporula TaxID=703511 RepID=A0A6G1I999_9PEZI|nr:hypothetical protein EJ06DRAFT_469890 [Trichodelitschia bisporula]
MPPRLRPHTPTLLRPLKSHPRLHRPTSTSATAPISPPPKPRRSLLRPLAYAALFLSLGWTSGTIASRIIRPSPLALPGTPQHLADLAELHTRLDSLPFVQRLRAEEAEGRWEELTVPWSSAGRLVGETLAGVAGLGERRVFWSGERGEGVVVFWVGGGMSGWPGLAHGGGVATVLVEGMGRGVQWVQGRKEGREAETFLGDTPPEPKHLGLTYVKPKNARDFYALRFKVLPPGEGGENGKGSYVVEGAAERLDGTVCVKARGVWVV